MLQDQFQLLLLLKYYFLIFSCTALVVEGEANSQSSAWHDNAPLEVAQREFERLQGRVKEIDMLIKNAVIVQVDKNHEHQVSIGSEVTYVDKDGYEKVVKIGSHTPADNSDSISYLSSFAILLIGSEVGDVVEGKVVNRNVEFEIIKINRWI